MDLIATGRMAEVFTWDDGRVLKLDRAEWNGCAALEQSVLERVIAAGIAAPRPHETVTVDDRLGLVMDRVDGPLLSDVVAAPGADVDALAALWTEMHATLNAREIEGLPDLVTNVIDGIRAAPLAPSLTAELLALLERLDDGDRNLCHFDLHPRNVIVGADGWVVIDWLSASAGPPTADFARTAVFGAPDRTGADEQFMRAVLRSGLVARGVDSATLDAWVRVLAAARIAEGFDGAYADFLTALASGERRVDG